MAPKSMYLAKRWPRRAVPAVEGVSDLTARDDWVVGISVIPLYDTFFSLRECVPRIVMMLTATMVVCWENGPSVSARFPFGTG